MLKSHQWHLSFALFPFSHFSLQVLSFDNGEALLNDAAEGDLAGLEVLADGAGLAEAHVALLDGAHGGVLVSRDGLHAAEEGLVGSDVLFVDGDGNGNRTE